MRVAICTDIHGNRHAFEAVIAAAEADGAEELWCLGDLVGYGAEPDACAALAEAHCAICLAGNHDLAVVDVLSLEEFSRGAASASSCSRSSRRGQARASASSTRRRATPCGSTCCPG
jgi:predicted phosphodiesterase